MDRVLFTAARWNKSLKMFVSYALVGILIVSSGCYSIQGVSGTQKYFLLQIGVVAHVVNNCAPLLDIEKVGGVLHAGLPYGSSITIPVASQPFTGSTRQISLTVKGRTASGEYLGSQTRTFGISVSEGTREEVWEITHLQLPSGRGGCM